MKNLGWYEKRICAVLLLGAATAIASTAQTLTTVVSFNGTNGAAAEQPLIQGTDGNFYGTTLRGGGSNSAGTIFKITPGGTLTQLYSFGSISTDGVFPSSGLIQATDGNFYGTTSGDSNSTFGTVFRITPGGTLTTLHNFCVQRPSCTDGATPTVMQANDGNFYGTTSSGGANNIGTVFRLTPDGTLTTLYNFVNVSGSAYDTPLGRLIQATDGNLYGTTGISVYKFTLAGALTTLYTFPSAGLGDNPSTLVQATDGNFYGVTTYNGANGTGTVFKLTPGGTLTTLYNFPAGAIRSFYDVSPLIQATDGNFYGTTNGSGMNQPNQAGTIFMVTPGGTLTTLYNFCSEPHCTDGSVSDASLIQATDGNLYGVTEYGGANNDGTVFRFQLSGGTVSAAGPSISGVVSASAFGGFSSVAPGSWVEIYGSNLAPATQGWTGSDFIGNNAPTMLNGVSVSIGGQAAFVDYISATQVNAQLPSNIATGGPLQLTVTNANGTSVPVNITVNTTEPGLLAPASFLIGANQYVVAQHSDGTYVLPVGAISGVASSPAKPGEILVIYGVGFGSVTPNIPAGEIATETNQLSTSFEVLFGKTPAKLPYFGLAPNFVGLYQFNVTVPAVANSNLTPLTFNLGGVAGTQTLYTAVQQ